jgi:hypothetical protein
MKTRKAYIIKKDGIKYWFNILTDTAEKVLRLQKMFKEEKRDGKTKTPKINRIR